MKPVIHLYTICWNEEAMLPFFFDYYDKFVDQYFFYDDGSTDESLAILESHARVEIRNFTRNVGDSYVLSAQKLHNSFWKNSAGISDWVIITAIDEYLWHPSILDYLIKAKNEKITAIPALGYQMISDFFPNGTKPILNQVRSGTPWNQMNKLSIFDPSRINETNYYPGRHKAEPEGDVIYPSHDEVLNLHFKYLSKEFVSQRHEELNDKLGKQDKERNFGHKYRWSLEELTEDWKQLVKNSIEDVLTMHTSQKHSTFSERWWRKH